MHTYKYVYICIYMHMYLRDRQCSSANRPSGICAPFGASQFVDSATQPVDRVLQAHRRCQSACRIVGMSVSLL